MEQLLSQVTWWHWLVLALILFGIEMVAGTFDLLMASIAAALTAAFAAFAPESATAWQVQCVVFAVACVGLIFISRYVFPGMRRVSPEHPTLNKRMTQLVGQRGEVTRDIVDGNGQVKIGDTVWGAEPVDASATLVVGDKIIVDSTRSNTAVVRKA